MNQNKRFGQQLDCFPLLKFMPAGDFALKINVGMSGRLKMARVILVLTTTGKDSHPNTYYTYIVCVCVISHLWKPAPKLRFFPLVVLVTK